MAVPVIPQLAQQPLASLPKMSELESREAIAKYLQEKSPSHPKRAPMAALGALVSIYIKFKKCCIMNCQCVLSYINLNIFLYFLFFQSLPTLTTITTAPATASTPSTMVSTNTIRIIFRIICILYIKP